MNDPRRHAWARSDLEGWRVCPLSTNCSIGQSLALGADQGEVSAGGIIEAKFDSVVMPEVELCQISAQVCFGDMEVAAVDTTLQDGEEPLGAVGRDIVSHIFFLGMIDGLMAGEGRDPTEIDWLRLNREFS